MNDLCLTCDRISNCNSSFIEKDNLIYCARKLHKVGGNVFDPNKMLGEESIRSYLLK